MIFSANVSMLFTEVPLLERFERAAEAGFSAVELWWPSGSDPDAVAAAVREAGVEVAALNFDAGDMPAGDRGLLSDPDRRERFRANVPVALDLAERLGCRRLNALAGLRRDDVEPAEQRRLALENARYAADEAARRGMTVLIEPINELDNGPYLLPTIADAVSFIEDTGRPNVALLFDVYHTQRTEGNVTSRMGGVADRLGHVQIADSPDRGEPGSGELNFRYLLSALAHCGYAGHVGLEYRPQTSTEESLGWLPPDQRAGQFEVDRLLLGTGVAP